MWPFERFRRPAVDSITEAEWQCLVRSFSTLAGLTADQEKRLRRLIAGFVRDKAIVAASGFQCGDEMRRTIAALACLPILELGLDWYAQLHTLIIYPDTFVHRHQTVDDMGVAHEWDAAMSGESWERGPVVLSWSDVEMSGQGQGYNVVIHEMAHRLDQLNGKVNGFPPLHANMDRHAWTRSFSSTFEAMNAALSCGEPVYIDSYAVEDPGEFFAVTSEYFFDQPALLRTHYPDVYTQLLAFYRQDPAVRLGSQKQ